ncbi:putative carbamoyl-phosphate synthase large chain, partial [Mycobacterium xenopi 4042]
MNPRVSRSSALASKAPGSRSPRSPPSSPSATPSTRSSTTSPSRPGLLRAHPGLRRGQGAAVRVREVRARPRTDHHHEIGRRSDVVGRNFIEALGKVMRSLETSRAGSGRRQIRRAALTKPCGGWPAVGK